MDDEELLRSLYIILEESRSSRDVDAVIESIANRAKRESLVRSILIVEHELGDLWQKQVLAYIVETTTLVRSTKNSSGKYIQSFESDGQINQNLILEGIAGFAEVDSLDRRYLYYPEFRGRLQVLKLKILKGRLDGILVLSAEEVIHRIMSFSGELLGLLEIDPISGETYNRFRKMCEPSPPRSTAYGALNEFINNVMKAKKNENGLDSGVAIGYPVNEKEVVSDVDGIADGIPVRSQAEEKKDKPASLKKARILKISHSSNQEKSTSKKDSGDESKKKED
ncbi:MAG: hypothetical protein NTV61_10600 [Candidatus Bathyarchaeota archaeon]|nr:hypothetical protein [Candidatus Bathyarchaeota archaeon]